MAKHRDENFRLEKLWESVIQHYLTTLLCCKFEFRSGFNLISHWSANYRYCSQSQSFFLNIRSHHSSAKSPPWFAPHSEWKPESLQWLRANETYPILSHSRTSHPFLWILPPQHIDTRHSLCLAHSLQIPTQPQCSLHAFALSSPSLGGLIQSFHIHTTSHSWLPLILYAFIFPYGNGCLNNIICLFMSIVVILSLSKCEPCEGRDFSFLDCFSLSTRTGSGP